MLFAAVSAFLLQCYAEIAPDQYAILTVDDVELKSGEVKEVEINLQNPIPITCITSDIILPEGCSFEQYYNEEDEEYVDLLLTDRKHSTHAVTTAHIDGKANHLRFVMFSLSNKNVKGTEGALIKFKIKVGEEMTSGTYEIKIAGQDIATADEQQANELGYTTTSRLIIYKDYTITIKDSQNGSVEGAGTYKSGTEVTLVATPDEGYHFVKWSNDITDNPYKFNIEENMELSAVFEASIYKIIYMVDGEEYKSVDVAFGETITAEAEPQKEGYIFSGWSEIPATMPADDIIVTGSFTFPVGFQQVNVNNEIKHIYTLDGKLVKTLQKGVNIVYQNDGTVRKVYVSYGK